MNDKREYRSKRRARKSLPKRVLLPEPPVIPHILRALERLVTWDTEWYPGIADTNEFICLHVYTEIDGVVDPPPTRAQLRRACVSDIGETQWHPWMAPKLALLLDILMDLHGIADAYDEQPSAVYPIYSNRRHTSFPAVRGVLTPVCRKTGDFLTRAR